MSEFRYLGVWLSSEEIVHLDVRENINRRNVTRAEPIDLDGFQDSSGT